MTNLVSRRQLTVEWSHCDPAGIVFNSRFFEYFDWGTWTLFEIALGVRPPDLAEGPERRRKVRPELSEAMKAAARLRSRGVCECANPNCWHFHQCKAPAVAFVARRSPVGVLSGVLFCRECARTAGGSEGRL